MSTSKKPNKTSSKPISGTLRADILELTKKIFATQGYAASSIRDIANLAGVTGAALYYHFKSKEDLLCEIIFEELDRIARDMRTALAQADSSEAALEAVIRAHLRYNVECPNESKIIIECSRYLSKTNHAASEKKKVAIMSIYLTCIEELTASGRIKTFDPVVTAFNIVSTIVGWYRWFRPGGRISKAEAFEYTVRFAMAGVLENR
ncbi:MAG: TetR/AcrR family transcriptional regulator [Burkholderiales bacterium]